jgi:hypothetical protein
MVLYTFEYKHAPRPHQSRPARGPRFDLRQLNIYKSSHFAAHCGGSHPFAGACGGTRTFAALGRLSPRPGFRRTLPSFAAPCGVIRPFAAACGGSQHLAASGVWLPDSRPSPEFTCFTNETVGIALMIRSADDFVVATLQATRTCTAVECCESLSKNVGVFHSLCKNMHGASARAFHSGPRQLQFPGSAVRLESLTYARSSASGPTSRCPARSVFLS